MFDTDFYQPHQSNRTFLADHAAMDDFNSQHQAPAPIPVQGLTTGHPVLPEKPYVYGARAHQGALLLARWQEANPHKSMPAMF